MSDTATDPPHDVTAPVVAAPTVAETAQAAGRLAKGWRLRNLARHAREVQLSGNALVGAGLSMTVLAGATLLWSGIATGAARPVVFLLSAGLLSLRLMIVRLGSVTSADGMAAPPPRGGLIRWLTPLETAVLMLAGGLSPFGSGSDIGPVLGLVAAGLVVLVSLRLRTDHALSEPSKPHTTSLLAMTCLAAMFEPLWGGRGQTVLIGLCAISAVLIVQAVRAPRRASA
jgi:hypothetical protein